MEKSLREFPSAVIVVVDLDDRDCLDFKQQMVNDYVPDSVGHGKHWPMLSIQAGHKD